MLKILINYSTDLQKQFTTCKGNFWVTNIGSEAAVIVGGYQVLVQFEK